MELKTFKVNGKTFTFACETKSTRNGFKHDCNLFVNGYNDFSATCHYLNRTWECYRYQTVMLRAVENMREYYADCIKCGFMYAHNYTRLTAKRRVEFERELSVDKNIKTCDKLRELILNA